MVTELTQVKVQIHTLDHIHTGYVSSPQLRLLDVLNDVVVGTLRVVKEFLPVSEFGVDSPGGSKTKVKCAYINKAHILFVRECGNGETSARKQAGHEGYPFVVKLPTPVKIYMPLYILAGQMHCAKGKHISDILNSELRFLPLTDVQMCDSLGNIESEVSFLAVNKQGILALEELGKG